MKAILAILLVSVLGAGAALAKCKDCGCKVKCTPECKCQHDKKAP